MTWSTPSRMGSKDDLLSKVAEDFDQVASRLTAAGSEAERTDILVVKDRALAAIAVIDTTPDSISPRGYQIRCEAYGTRGRFGVNFTMKVDRVFL